MSQIFIVGFGKFGKMALPIVRRHWGRSRVWIIDHDPAAFVCQSSFPGICVLDDGPQFLSQYQKFIGDEDWIIPSLPIHLAWKWLDLNITTPGPRKAVRPPAELGNGLPYAQQLGKGLVVSFATSICPDNCPAPLVSCFKTKARKPVPLWRHLTEHPNLKGTIGVIESRQIAPGIGGFLFKELRRIQTVIQQSTPPFYLATACRCHGIIHGFTW
jgi:hypothetical protein